MHPYRTTDHGERKVERDAPAEELVLAGALVAIGGLRVCLALIEGGTFGVEPTVAAILAIAGVAIFIRWWWPRDREPPPG